jgi:hypothetical protein
MNTINNPNQNEFIGVYVRPGDTQPAGFIRIQDLMAATFATLTASGAIAGSSVASVGDVNGATVTSKDAVNGQTMAMKQVTVELTGMAGVSVTATDLIPSGAFVIGVTARVTTLITSGDTATSFSVGDGVDPDAWGAGIAFAANTITDGSDFTLAPTLYATADDVVITPNSGTFSAGAIRLTVHYMEVTAPTS